MLSRSIVKVVIKMSNEEMVVKLAGYLHHKGRKVYLSFIFTHGFSFIFKNILQKVISFWRRWYCVLNGSLLLFYESESDYLKLGKFHDTLDLGLVYDVQTAPGMDHCIQISTANGSQWLVLTNIIYLAFTKLADINFVFVITENP